MVGGYSCHLVFSSEEARLGTDLGGVSCRGHSVPRVQLQSTPATAPLVGELTPESGLCSLASVPRALSFVFGLFSSRLKLEQSLALRYKVCFPAFFILIFVPLAHSHVPMLSQNSYVEVSLHVF